MENDNVYILMVNDEIVPRVYSVHKTLEGAERERAQWIAEHYYMGRYLEIVEVPLED